MKNVCVIGTVGVPACYGGFESLVENMLDYTPEDVEYTVFCTSKKYDTKLDSYKGAKLKYLELNANGKDSIMYDYKSMKMSLDADIMLILGVSGCIFLPFIRRKFRGKIITNIDGLEWKRDKWNFVAKWLLHYSEKMAVKYSDVVIGDNKGITDYIMEEYPEYISKENKKLISSADQVSGAVRNPVLIAYGSDHAKKVNDESFNQKYTFMNEPYAVTVCRIEPENNIQRILEAFSRQEKIPLVMVGNWAKSEFGREMKDKYGSCKSIVLLDPIYESHEINCIRSNAALYIHGHSAGGTNPSLVEAMHLGLPVFAFDCIYNRATTFENCFYWRTPEELQGLLENISESQKELCGTVMHDLAVEHYTWNHIAEQYNALY